MRVGESRRAAGWRGGAGVEGTVFLNIPAVETGRFAVGGDVVGDWQSQRKGEDGEKVEQLHDE